MTRTPRQVVVEDGLWEALGELARRLGVDRNELVVRSLRSTLAFHGPPPAPAPARPAGGRGPATRHVLAAATDLERQLGEPKPGLALHREAGPPIVVSAERFVIGRGRHCDLVIASAKVSREHAVIRREPDGWWIEDLGSSNGTWLERTRIDRRRIQDGDVYLVCAEKIRCVLSPSP